MSLTIWVLLSSCLLTAVVGEDESCAVWEHIATQLSSTSRGGAQQSCLRGSDPCTSVYCNGTYQFSSKNAVLLPQPVSVEVDYCFGIILNHCDVPLNLVFYMQVPARKVNNTVRVYHNTLLALPGLRYNISAVGTAEGFLYFEMERKEEDLIVFSVTVKVRLTSKMFGEIWPGSLQRRLISKESVSVPPCDSDGRNKTTPLPKLGVCHPLHWKETPQPKISESAMLSGNLGRKCDELTPCDDAWLVCDAASSLCQCGPDFGRVSAEKGSFCAPLSRLGETCGNSTEDGCPGYMHVKCLAGICVCREGFTRDDVNLICVRSRNDAPKPASTPHAASKTSHDGGKGRTALIAGSVIGSVVVLAGILLVAYFAIRRLRRPYRNRELLLENDDSDGIM